MLGASVPTPTLPLARERSSPSISVHGPAPPASCAPGAPDPHWDCYAAKGHPEQLALSEVGGAVGEAQLALTYVCNTGEANKELFQAGGMEMRIRGYWPKFLRVTARLA